MVSSSEMEVATKTELISDDEMTFEVADPKAFEVADVDSKTPILSDEEIFTHETPHIVRLREETENGKHIYFIIE